MKALATPAPSSAPISLAHSFTSTVTPEINRIMEQVNVIDEYLATHMAQRTKIATDPLYELFQRVVEGEVSEFEMSLANLRLLSRNDERWFPIMANAMETPDAKLRDLRLHRLCELVVSLQVIHYEIPGNVLYAWILRMLLDRYRIQKRFENSTLMSTRHTPRNYGLDFELELAKRICLPIEGFVGPLAEARRKPIIVRDLDDVSGDFAWSADMLSKRYEMMVRTHGKPF